MQTNPAQTDSGVCGSASKKIRSISSLQKRSQSSFLTLKAVPLQVIGPPQGTELEWGCNERESADIILSFFYKQKSLIKLKECSGGFKFAELNGFVNLLETLRGSLSEQHLITASSDSLLSGNKNAFEG